MIIKYIRKVKKIISLLLVIVLSSTVIPLNVLAQEKNEKVYVSLSMYSNKTNDKSISGYYYDNMLYVSINDICKITGATVKEKDEDKVYLSLNGGCRDAEISINGNVMKEVFYSDSYSVYMPSFAQNNVVYVSMMHFLNYIGANYEFRKESKPQLIVVVQYSIFDALTDYNNTNQGNFFSWDEVDCGNEKLEDKLVNAGVVALINRDSNIFRMMFDAKGIEREAIEDALVSIITNEGVDYFDSNNSQLEFLNIGTDVLSAESDIVDFVTKVYKTGATETLGKYINEFASESSAGFSTITNYLNALETYKQFDAITETERTLLEKTILTHPEDSSTLCDGWDNVLNATENVNKRSKDAFENKYQIALETADGLGYDFLNGIADGTSKNPISAAWDGAILINKLIPYTSNMIDKKTQLYNAYLCSMIQYIAKDFFADSYSKLYYSNFFYDRLSLQLDCLQQLKYDLILQLKSTLTTREYLINSGFLTDEYASEMKSMNKKTAELLNKVENCSLSGVGVAYNEDYKDDYSWLSEFKDNSLMYYDYIKQNLNVIDSTDFPRENNKKQGVFSALIDDFDDDGTKEMVTASIVLNTADQEYVVFELYCIENDKVVSCDKTKEFYASGAGNYSNEFCATYNNKELIIQYSNWNFGGSSHSEEYTTLRVNNKKFVFKNDFTIYEFYRYDQLQYKEETSGKIYSSLNEIENDIVNAGYESHNHVGYTDSSYDIEKNDYETNEMFKGNHMFTLVNSNSLLTSGLYGFLHDNTNLLSSISKDMDTDSNAQISEEDLKEKHEAAVEFYGKYIYGPCEYQDFEHQINDGELTLTKYGDIDTYSEFLDEAKKYFTEETAINILKSINAQDYNGHLYTTTNGGVGSVLMGEELTIKKVNNSKYHITSKYEWPGNTYTTSSRNFVYENGNWVLDDANFEF